MTRRNVGNGKVRVLHQIPDDFQSSPIGQDATSSPKRGRKRFFIHAHTLTSVSMNVKGRDRDSALWNSFEQAGNHSCSATLFFILEKPGLSVNLFSESRAGCGAGSGVTL
jgi:hypothetical protein